MTNKSTTKSKTKKQILIGLLSRKNGATRGAIEKSTGWQPHTVRAAISGLRKAGFEIESEPGNDGRRYRITRKPAQ